ncbi:hypothetical protein [Altererythrobacter sp. ZODW24]|uniref:hypothetical protein n=1 Tax=Altererythrobacter sp. ZODW24 TaxID=2185142 RepID=UPI000DF7E566|nr:hypothetical protein [Altererythrobacter sp. ZODW24]
MTFNKLAATTAALTLAAVPVAAQAANAERASQPAAATSSIGGDANQLFLLAALAAIAVGIFFLADEDDDAPVSA